MQIKFAAIGALSLDRIRFKDGRTYEGVFGGSAGYAAVGASFFGSSSIVTNVGKDYPAEFLEKLEDRGIDTSGIRMLKEELSSRFSISYDDELTEKEGTTIELNALLAGINIPENIQDCKYVFIAGNDPTLQLAIMDELKGEHTIAVSTHMHWIREQPDLVLEVIRRSNIVFINDKELCVLTGKKQLRNAGQELFKYGISLLIVKKGEHGAVLFQKDRIYPVISYDRMDMVSVDPTGCGGILVGAFMGFLASNGEKREPLKNEYFKALAFGLVVRSFKIEDVSYRRLLTLKREDIWRRYDHFRDMLTL